MQTYLLTYNPDSASWPAERKNRLGNEIEEAQKKQPKPVRWNCAKAVAEGDRALLHRQGNKAFGGIFGVMEASGRAFPDPEGKLGRYYAKWTRKHIVNPDKVGPIIPTEELKRRFPQVNWDTRKSGIRVDESIADTLESEILARCKD